MTYPSFHKWNIVTENVLITVEFIHSFWHLWWRIGSMSRSSNTLGRSFQALGPTGTQIVSSMFLLCPEAFSWWCTENLSRETSRRRSSRCWNLLMWVSQLWAPRWASFCLRERLGIHLGIQVDGSITSGSITREQDQKNSYSSYSLTMNPVRLELNHWLIQLQECSSSTWLSAPPTVSSNALGGTTATYLQMVD